MGGFFVYSPCARKTAGASLFHDHLLINLLSDLVSMVLRESSFCNPMTVLSAQIERLVRVLNRFGLVLVLADLVDPVKYRIII